jgi:hypothetical protein
MRHAKIHATNKPFPCLHCDKGYVDANSLRKHMRNHECEVSGVPQLQAVLLNRIRQTVTFCRSGTGTVELDLKLSV